MESILRDMRSQEFNDIAAETMNIDLYENQKVWHRMYTPLS